MSNTDKTLVLNESEVELKIQRIAWEVYEKHANEKDICLVGISKSGYWLAKRIQGVLLSISDIKLELVEMAINKQNPLADTIRLSVELSSLKNRNVVLVDDVLNSGKVLIYGVRHLLNQPIKLLTTAVLVDRNHKRYPVKGDVKGLSLSTSLNEHVEVVIKKDSAKVYLH